VNYLSALTSSILFLAISGCSTIRSFELPSFELPSFELPKSDLNAFLDGDLPGEVEAVDDVVDQEGDNAAKRRVIKQQCPPEADPKYSYRRGIALLAFDIRNRRDSVDFSDIERQYPEILGGFIDQERFIVKPATHLRLLNEIDRRSGAWVEPKSQQIKQLADELGVQFIVTGMIEDMSIEDPSIGVMRLVMDSAARKKIMGKVIRHLAVSMNVYDGGTGVVIKRQTFADKAYVNVDALKQRKSLSQEYFRSHYGTLMTEILKQQSDFIIPALDCIPMQAKIVAVDDMGVTVDVGTESLVVPGDKLQLFRRVAIDWRDSPEKRYRLERYGVITVSRSSLLTAHGYFDFEDMASGVNPGDIVQAW